jgi:hypothetical protein
MLITLSGRVISVSPVQPLKAELPIEVTPSGIVMLGIFDCPAKALSLIADTGSPSIVEGIVTSPPGPPYPVMVIPDRLLVYWKILLFGL